MSKPRAIRIPSSSKAKPLMTHLSERVGSRESPTRPRARARTGSTLRSQSLLWRRPIGRQTNDASGTFLDEAIALGMVLRQRHIHLAESLFDRVHHHVRPADKVLMVGIRRWQMALEHISG